MTLADIVAQRAFRLVVRGTPDDVSSDFSELTLPPPFAYPYGSSHTWSLERFSGLLKSTQSAEAFDAAFSFDDDNDHVAVSAHANCQDTIWLVEAVKEIGEMRKPVYFVPLEDDHRGIDPDSAEFYIVMPSAQDITQLRHKSAWCRLTREEGFKLLIHGPRKDMTEEW